MVTSKQYETWISDFGIQYTDRNNMTPEQLDNLYIERFGVPRYLMNKEFIGDLPRDIKVLEVGCNVGLQLQILQNMGFINLYGIEIQSYAIEIARAKTQGINILPGDISDIPFKDNYFDMVFTSGVLIHVPPSKLNIVMGEIIRCTRKYIWCYEYYADSLTTVNYRGYDDILWRGNYKDMFVELGGIKVCKSKLYKYFNTENIDTMFLLEKEISESSISGR